MLTDIKKAIFSLAGLSIGLGVLGFLSGVVQLFVDVNAEVSVKWLLVGSWVGLSVIFILLKLIFDLHLRKDSQPNYESPIRFFERDGILLIRKNENFLNQIIVGCYYTTEEIERLAYVGVVHHTQEHVIQIRIVRSFLPMENDSAPIVNVNHLIVRPVVPFSALDRLTSQE